MSIIIFNHRRDLRLIDNLTIFKLLENNNMVIPVFFFDPHQIIKNNNNKDYFSEKAAYFIINSVLDLKQQYQNINSNLLILYDRPHSGLELIIKTVKNIIKIAI